MLLYEAGQALRFDELSIQTGERGILNVLSSLGLIRKRRLRKKIEPFIANRSDWTRASASGFVCEFAKLGAYVEKGQVLAEINSPLGELIQSVVSNRTGIVIGKQNIPLVLEGDAMFHVAYFGSAADEVAEHIEIMNDQIMPLTTQTI